jgi:hypothetical protein
VGAVAASSPQTVVTPQSPAPPKRGSVAARVILWSAGILVLGFFALLAIAVIFSPSKAERTAETAKVAREREKHDADLYSRMQDAIAKQQWREAATVNSELKTNNPQYPGRVDAEKTVLEQVRLLDIDDGIRTADELSKSPSLCQSPQSVTSAWKQLQNARESDAHWKQALVAAGKVETCRKKALDALKDGVNMVKVALREAWMKKADTVFLDQGMNVDIDADGKAKDDLEIKWALMSRAAVYKFTKDGTFFKTLTELGFRKVTFTDGYGEYYGYDLNPEPDTSSEDIQNAMRQSGISEPFKLTGR